MATPATLPKRAYSHVKLQIIEFTGSLSPADRIGPSFANFHLILAKIKEVLDPNNIANPIRFIDIEAMKKAEK